MIIEIGFALPDNIDLLTFEEKVAKLGYPFYVEPPNRFVSLEDLECQCEGK